MRRAATIILLLLVVCGGAGADDIVAVYVDGKKTDFKPAARVRDGKSYAPLRAVSEALGAEVEWNAAAQMAIICRTDFCVPIKKSDGIIVENHLLVPLRLLSEALGAKISWDSTRRAVTIKSPPRSG